MTSNPKEMQFSSEILGAISENERRHFAGFAESIGYAERLLHQYNMQKKPRFTGATTDPLGEIQENSRLAFVLTWTKAILFSRAIVNEINAGNLLVAFQALRGYVELVAAARYTINRMKPLVIDASASGQVSSIVGKKLTEHLQILLRGGRFDWATYFEEGPAAILDKKRMKRTQQQKSQFENSSLRIGNCITDWAKDNPSVEFIYDYLCDLVHPNKGSNLILLVDSEEGVIFDADRRSRIGMLILERIFPYVASMCLGAMSEIHPFFAILLAEDQVLH